MLLNIIIKIHFQGSLIWNNIIIMIIIDQCVTCFSIETFLVHLLKGISLKFSKWFIKWFVEIFPIEINEVYLYFQQNSTFVLGYRLISFIASQAITWIVYFPGLYFCTTI